MFKFLRNYKSEKLVLAKKLIQSFNDFERRFPTEEDSVEHFARALLTEFIIRCRICGCTDLARAYGSRFYFCRHCGTKGWIFTNTYFDKMRKAKLWNATMWLFEHKVQFNAWQLAELCKVAYSSALVICRKIAKVILSLSENVELVPSGVFTFLFCKRSLETPANSHPRVEQYKLDEAEDDIQDCVDEANENSGDDSSEDTSKNSKDDVVIDVVVEPAENTDLEKMILQILDKDPIHFDDICLKASLPGGEASALLVMLELEDKIQRHGGDFYSRVEQTKLLPDNMKFEQKYMEDPTNSQRIEEFKNYIVLNFHGFSRKYLQFYLAAFESVFHEGFITSGKILKECLYQRSFTYLQMLEYVSPPNVTLGRWDDPLGIGFVKSC